MAISYLLIVTSTCEVIVKIHHASLIHGFRAEKAVEYEILCCIYCALLVLLELVGMSLKYGYFGFQIKVSLL